MNIKLNFKKLIKNLLIVMIILTTNYDLLAQEKKLADFKLVVEKTDKGIKLTCESGCAWKELTYNVNDSNPTAIDENGMTELNKNSSDKDSNLTEFLFILTKTNKGINLKGIKGTAWTDLSFTLTKNQKQTIDQTGMTN